MEAEMKYKRFINWIFLVCAATMLVACGFHLRGADGTSGQLPFSSIYIDFPADSQTSARLKRLIKGMKLTKLAANPKDAEVILSAISEKKNKEYLSLNSQGRVREFSLDYTLEFTARTPQGKTLIEPAKLSLRRTMTYNDNEALSKENEELMLYKDMQFDMAYQLLRRLSSIKRTAISGTEDQTIENPTGMDRQSELQTGAPD